MFFVTLLAVLLAIGVRPASGAEVSMELIESTVPVSSPDITITALRPPAAASQTNIPASEIADIPTRIDSADILRTVPGLQIAQHEGGGKANEYMLRGFYADHGTDIAFSADGLPLNLVSHAHGQGYTDLHMIIPETVEDVAVEKGPYDPEQGDLATAGSVALKFFDRLPENFISLTGGSYDTGRVAAGVNLPGVLSRSYLVVDDYRTDGYVQSHEDYKRLNLFYKGSEDLTPDSKVTFLATSFSSSWFASGLIPSRAVDEGLISPLGSMDPTQGGSTERHNLSATYDDDIDNQQHVQVQAYYTRYILQLYSDFTFFLNNPVQGDGIEQDDNRQMFGGHADYSYKVPVAAGDWVSTFGVESRNDSDLADLWNQQDRVRISSVSISDIWEQSVGVYDKEEVPITSRLRFMGGLRYDRARFEADGNSGSDGILSPKASFIYAASPDVDLFANYGRGFHSNDARTVSTDPGSGLIRAQGVETGVRARALDDRLTSSLVFWGMDLDSELTLDQDTGGTEPSGPSRRAGIENEWTYTITSWLRSDLDLDFSQAKYRDTGGDVPLAVNQYISGGVSAHLPSGWESSLRFRDVGARWGDDARTIPLQAYCVFDGMIGYQERPLGLSISGGQSSPIRVVAGWPGSDYVAAAGRDRTSDECGFHTGESADVYWDDKVLFLKMSMQTELKPLPHLPVIHPDRSAFDGSLDYEPLERPSGPMVLALSLAISLTLHLAMLPINGTFFFQARPAPSAIEVDLTEPYEMVPPNTARNASPVRKGSPEDHGRSLSRGEKEQRSGSLIGPDEGAEFLAHFADGDAAKLRNKEALAEGMRKFYPESERRAGHEGKVTLELHLDTLGRVTKADVAQSGGTAFDQAALQIAPLLDFEPARAGTRAVPVKLRQTISFQLIH